MQAAADRGTGTGDARAGRPAPAASAVSAKAAAGAVYEERWESFTLDEDGDGGAPVLRALAPARGEPLPRYGRVPVPAHLQSWLSAGPGRPPQVSSEGIAGALADFAVRLERARQHLKNHRPPRLAASSTPPPRPASVGTLRALTTGSRPALQRLPAGPGEAAAQSGPGGEGAPARP